VATNPNDSPSSPAYADPTSSSPSLKVHRPATSTRRGRRSWSAMVSLRVAFDATARLPRDPTRRAHTITLANPRTTADRVKAAAMAAASHRTFLSRALYGRKLTTKGLGQSRTRSSARSGTGSLPRPRTRLLHRPPPQMPSPKTRRLPGRPPVNLEALTPRAAAARGLPSVLGGYYPG